MNNIKSLYNLLTEHLTVNEGCLYMLTLSKNDINAWKKYNIELKRQHTFETLKNKI